MAALWVAAAAAIASVGVGAYSAATAPGMPKAPDLAGATRAGTEAEAATLADRRGLEAAAQQGGKYTYHTHAHEEKRPMVQIYDSRSGRTPSGGKWVLYDAKDWEKGGKYADKDKFRQGRIKDRNTTIPGEEKTVDFSGHGEADVQGAIAKQNADTMLELSQKYGPQFAETARQQLELADPEGTKARAMANELIHKQMNEEPDRPVAKLLDEQVAAQLAAGDNLDSVSSDVLNDAVRASLADRGDSSGADFAEPLTTGFEGRARGAAGRQKALSWLSSGSTPEDVRYRREQQNLANLGAFVNGQSPESQFGDLSGAQQGAAPFYPGRPLPGQNPSAGGTMAGAQMQGWNTQMQGQMNEASPWMAGLSALLRGASAAGKSGWSPFGTPK